MLFRNKARDTFSRRPNPLLLPEIIACVGPLVTLWIGTRPRSRVFHPKDLVACTCVCWTWRQIMLPLLWHTYDGNETTMQKIPIQTLLKYRHHLREIINGRLDFKVNGRWTTLIEHTPHIRSLAMNGAPYGQYMVSLFRKHGDSLPEPLVFPFLTTLELGNDTCDRMLLRIMAMAPNLKTLLLINLHTVGPLGLAPSQTLDLTALHIQRGTMQEGYLADLLKACPQIEDLALETKDPLDWPSIDRVLKDLKVPLKKLGLSLHGADAPISDDMLASLISGKDRTLQRLMLRSIGLGTLPLEAILGLDKLTHLYVKIQVKFNHRSGRDIAPKILRHCSQLQDFEYEDGICYVGWEEDMFKEPWACMGLERIWIQEMGVWGAPKVVHRLDLPSRWDMHLFECGGWPTMGSLTFDAIAAGARQAPLFDVRLLEHTQRMSDLREVVINDHRYSRRRCPVEYKSVTAS